MEKKKAEERLYAMLEQIESALACELCGSRTRLEMDAEAIKAVLAEMKGGNNEKG